MLNAIEAYLTLCRAMGFAMQNAECLLKSFAAFATERGQTHCGLRLDRWPQRADGPSLGRR